MDHSKLLFKYSLPKEVLDLISKFNVEHRCKMKKVFRYINNIIYTCFICDIYIIPHIHIAASIMMKRTFVCSDECKDIATEYLNEIGLP